MSIHIHTFMIPRSTLLRVTLSLHCHKEFNNQGYSKDSITNCNFGYLELHFEIILWRLNQIQMFSCGHCLYRSFPGLIYTVKYLHGPWRTYTVLGIRTTTWIKGGVVQSVSPTSQHCAPWPRLSHKRRKIAFKRGAPSTSKLHPLDPV